MNERTTQTTHDCEVHGEILRSVDLAIASSRPESLVDLPGEFWVAIKSGKHTTLVASRNGTRQCFYFTSGAQFFYGASVAEILKASGVGWRWNWKAAASLSYFGHTLGSDTLHADIHRLGPGEIVYWDGSKVSVQNVPSRNNARVHNPQESAIEALDAFIRQHGDEATLPLSAGFDSRLLLAAFLAAGHKPQLFVMGHPAATDVRIATAIASTCGLPIRRVDLPLDEYVRDRDTITCVTSGTKTPDNWHTYIGTKLAGLEPGIKLFPGANGEYARTFYFDRGWMFHTANLLSAITVKKFWQSKLKRYAELPPGSNESLTSYFNGRKQDILDWLFSHYGSPDSLGDIIARFYLRERVRTFIANGLSLYSCFAKLRLPFLDADWISAVEQMSHRNKLHSNWHRYAIGRLYPKLLDYPTDDSGREMGAPLTPRARLGVGGKGSSVGYAPKLFQDMSFRSAVIESLGAIDDVVDVAAAKTMVQDGSNGRAIAFVSGLAFWRDYLKRTGEIRGGGHTSVVV